MREEFHGSNGAPYKQLYGWGTINANVWLPSLIELVGYNPDSYTEWNGCYYSAMQGMNVSGGYYVDAKGGEQFAYFKQFNQSGGGEKIWSACKQEITWLRSSYYGSTKDVWRTGETNFGGNYAAYNSFAVHPAVLGKAGLPKAC